MSELEKDFGSFRGEHGPTSSPSEEGIARPRALQGKDIARPRTLKGRTWPDLEFFKRRTWPDFELFRADLDAYVVHWNTRSRQVKLKRLTPEEFRSQSLVA